MKKILKAVVVGLTVFIAYCSPTNAQNNSLPQGIVTAVSGGNAQKLANYFNDNIELVFPQKSGIYSKSQAQMILKEFFTKNPPSSFKIIHQGSRQNASFAIGNYSSGNNFYRFYFLTKKNNNKILIHQLRIEK